MAKHTYKYLVLNTFHFWGHPYCTYAQKSPKSDSPPALYAIVHIWFDLPLCVRTFYIFAPPPLLPLINFYSDLSFRHSQFLGYFHLYLSLG